MPATLLQKLLAAKQSANLPPLASVARIRLENEKAVIAVADRLGLNYSWDEYSATYVTNQESWDLLEAELLLSGMSFYRIAETGSYAASTSWSAGLSQLDARSQGTGARWNVFPGEIDPKHDALDFVGPIDVVYTWVNAEDPNWLANYRQALVDENSELESSAADLGRFVSHDELRYSLRSLELNLPWINNIFLVTEGHVPEWLVAEHPKLTIVDHAEIFDPQCLPTFNSHAIESRLSFIPGLSEHFIYVNDDVFFGKPLSPNTFFGPTGQAKFSLSQGHFADAAETELPVNVAAANNRELVVSSYGRTTSRKFKHVAHPQRLNVHRLAHEKYKEKLTATAMNKFRNPADVSLPSSLAHQLAARTGQGYPTEFDYAYLDIGSPSLSLQALRLSRRNPPHMFCLNEVRQSTDTHQRARVVKLLLEVLFPYRSSFEK
ncbi:stealth conserved region 3 domain-containing protein [Glutamicibacter arilaitensis]|uniref:stealth family protein n=1 Tax=Glutamicibacter arilaitensis TaxID=256701 RepID=UPI003850D866